MIDIHCHLNFAAFKNDWQEVYQNALSAGVTTIINVGTNLETSQKAIEIADKLPYCFASVGIHPHHAKDLLIGNDKDLKNKLLKLAQNKKVVAIGETGLDYYEYQITKYPENKITPEIKEKQRELLKIHRQIADKLNLPLIFHCREALDEMISLLKKDKISKEKAVFHCFGGNVDHLKQILGLGFYIGFDGNIGFKNREDLCRLVKLTPVERILTETDSPYLTPEPFKGRNEPRNVRIVIEQIEKIKKLKSEEVEKITAKNALNLFRFKHSLH